MKIIPAIDLMEGKVVRLYKGDPSKKTIYSDNPLEIAKKWESAGADMIHLVDLDATLGKGSNFEILGNIAKSVKIPVQIAGGLRNEKIIESALEFAQRAVIGTLAFKDKTTLGKLLAVYGSKKLVISVDHNDGLVAVNGWQQTTNISLVDAVNEFKEMGFSEYLSTNISRDGTLHGPDLIRTRTINEIENVNLIVSGGISNVEDVVKVKELNPFGVILGKALYENQITIEEAKQV
uniref:1-(5-phosphoribosyl)-5-[(5-phosphoribosylamino)methylideneamino] imidazole-4-carboxamide isomerase n=1 Tax=uncultured marine thaumarchaeote AD1000_63_F07 TaxID=1455928 RepID=A0A075FVD4_9ARCH|nr:1-(5-phosphoribosyl)-5-((5-phosphoribosylamino)methylideneamino)imidazole-4-carboxamideisomerase (hisA) [uncultured marine thaumarchaeote AD1000_63_F07]